jgi:dihydropyrimidine dehydrogenase (NAD+) subunit PreA
VKDEECVACNLCVDVCPVDCITMRELAKGETDPRTGREVGDYANWTTHPNNPSSASFCGLRPAE